MTDDGIDLIVNCFERNLSTVLDGGFFQHVEELNRRSFDRRHLLVNNVGDREGALAIAHELLAGGFVDAVTEVAPSLPAALRAVQLEREDLGRLPHYSDCCFVAVTTASPNDHFVYWDADIALAPEGDWVSPSLDLLRREPRVLTAAPGSVGVEREEARRLGPFSLNHGFSDQVFLGRRSDFGRPMYRDRSIVATVRNPLSPYGRIFETRVEAHLRATGRYRASHLGIRYVHPAGGPRPPKRPAERAAAAAHGVGRLVLRQVPGRWARWRA